MRLIALLFCLVLTSAAHANLSKDLTGFFQKMGSRSNISSGGVYKDQSAGYYTGGRMFVRNQTRDLHPVQIQLPSTRAGCGGIDLFTGGLSFIQKGELVQALRSVGQNAASYAFLLAIQTVSPQIYNIMEYLNALAQKINQANINSCETAATLLGGVWPRSDQSSKHLCSMMGSNMGAFSDWAEARQECGAGGQREDVLSRRRGSGRHGSGFKDTLTPPYNLVWTALQKKPFLAQDSTLAELFMSLSGTIVVTDVAQTLPSLMDRGDLIQTLMNGGEAALYRCDRSGHCLDPQIRTVTLGAGLYQQVSEVIQGIYEKIAEDQPLSEEEISFLNLTVLPVYKMMNVATAYRKGAVPLDARDYIQLIAFDLVVQYITEILDVVQQAVQEIRPAQVEEDQIRLFLKSLREVRRQVAEKRAKAFNHLHATVSLIEKTRLLEQQLYGQMGTVALSGGG